jgi:hydroxylysine kinase
VSEPGGAERTAPVGTAEALTGASPPISEAEAQRIARIHYGLEGQAKRLTGEKDENFRLDAGSSRYVLKVAHVVEPSTVLELICEAMSHVRRVAPELPVAIPIAASDGEHILRFESEAGDARIALMTTYLDGTLLRHAPASVQLRLNFGRAVARTQQALRHFEHAGLDRYVMWDLQHSDGMRELLGELESTADGDRTTRYAPVREVLDRFDEQIRPRLSTLPRQPLHNDLSTDNTLIADDHTTVAGILDFGDMTLAPRICDLGTAATNQLDTGAQPMRPVGDVVRGYTQLLPLAASELELLCDLVRLRLAKRIIITEWRAARFPENRDYIIRNTAEAWALLGRIPVEQTDQVTAGLISASRGE